MPADSSRFADAAWLTGARAFAAGRIFAIVLLANLALAALLAAAHFLTFPDSKPPALDFAAFYAAAKFALSGHPALAYDNEIVGAFEHALLEMPPGYLAFYYPPPFLLLCLPLGLLPYGFAAAAFVVSETALLIGLLRRILTPRWAWLPLLSFPGFIMNALVGQNATLTACCFAGSALWLEKRPLLAGMCLGGLVYKPQLAVCVPIALLAARRGKALLAFATTALLLGLISWIKFGGDAWLGFLANAANARADIETVESKWPLLQSAFGAVRLAGGGVGLAYAVQVAVSAAAVIALLRTCGRRPGAQLEASMMATAALLFTPFLYDYELAILAVPMAALCAAALRSGWRSWEKLLLLALFLLPFAARPAGLFLHATIGPPFVAALLAALALRAVTPSEPAPTPALQKLGEPGAQP